MYLLKTEENCIQWKLFHFHYLFEVNRLYNCTFIILAAANLSNQRNMADDGLQIENDYIIDFELENGTNCSQRYHAFVGCISPCKVMFFSNFPFPFCSYKVLLLFFLSWFISLVSLKCRQIQINLWEFQCVSVIGGNSSHYIHWW